jgi:hypothetical protein
MKIDIGKVGIKLQLTDLPADSPRNFLKQLLSIHTQR